MKTMSRRSFLAGSAATATGIALGSSLGAAASSQPLRMGVQSYSFRKFDLEGTIKGTKELGLNEIEFYGKHIPFDAAEADLAQIKATLQAEGIIPVGYGVVNFDGDSAERRRLFEFGKALGIEYFSVNPKTDAFDDLDALSQEFGIKVACHNHGPGTRFDKVDDVLRVCTGRNPLIGACYDTGHSIKSDEKPHEVIKQLGDRLHSIHLKDRVYGGGEKRIGSGDMDLVAVIRALREINFNGPIVMEFEVVPDDPVPSMARGLGNWNRAVEAA